ncbi:MAG TPA: 5-oxoprolinase subunit PxpA [Gemmatimonadales bacterium]|nr:5-oxoprolinase subunit PxpA [Gemmatimonadales bacterium]
MPSLFQVDLNADLGEIPGPWERAPDSELLELVSSASVACGGHAGDAETMRRTVAAAKRLGVTVGAHPGYPDREGFGRREVGASPADVGQWVREQVSALLHVAAAERAEVRYVKPHGAMYNRAGRDAAVAVAIARAVREVDPELALLGLASSALMGAADEEGLRAVPEAFLDRGYAIDGTLLPRDAPGAVLDDPEEVARRAVRLVREGRVRAGDGTELSLRAASYCVHGDGRHPARLVRAVRAAFASEGIAVASFAR